MSHPRYQYMAGKPRKISFNLLFFKGPVKKSVDLAAVALVPRTRRNDAQKRPHYVLFMFGDLYSGVLCVVRQVKARFFYMFDCDSLLPQHAEVDVLLEEYIDESVDYSEVRG